MRYNGKTNRKKTNCKKLKKNPRNLEMFVSHPTQRCEKAKMIICEKKSSDKNQDSKMNLAWKENLAN